VDAPTATQIREWSKVNFAELGFPAPTDPDPDPLAIEVERSIAEFQRDTSTLVSEVNVEGADEKWSEKRKEEEKGLELLVGEAIQMYTEWRIGSSQPEVLESTYDFDVIQSFSAGSYSETRRGFMLSSEIKHPWPRLNRLLLLISGGLDGGEVPVVGGEGIGFEGVDWERQRYIIDACGRRGWLQPGFTYQPPWDGVIPQFP
jgi:hypothetical protein